MSDAKSLYGSMPPSKSLQPPPAGVVTKYVDYVTGPAWPSFSRWTTARDIE